jgi:O-antigen ligase
VSLNLFKSSSVFGLGWGWEERAIDSQLLNVWAVSAHNAILEITFSAGIVGLVIFMIMLTKGLVFFPNLLVIEKVLLGSILVSGISEAYIDLQYPTIQTFIFFLIILTSNKHLVRKS